MNLERGDVAEMDADRLADLADWKRQRHRQARKARGGQGGRRTDTPMDDLMRGYLADIGVIEDELRDRRTGRREPGVTRNREANFNRRTGRFANPITGQFEAGRAPPDLDRSVNRYRGKDGRFKTRSADLYDEPAEVRRNSLEPRG